jgi:transmembrane sensor
MNLLNKNILFEHFAGRTTPLQKKLISDWLQSSENQELYYRWLEDYENEYPQILMDKDLAKSNFFEKIKTDFPEKNVYAESFYEENVERNPAIIWQQSWLKWSAAAVVFLGLGLAFYSQKDSLIYQEYQTTFGETKIVNLPDGSKITLNANSVLKFHRFGFADEEIREVYLDGEAEFSVKHTPKNQKFVVKTSHKMEVEVLGTEFTVFARNRGAKVVLNKGKVKVNYLEGSERHTIMMKPGNLLALDKKNVAEVQEVVEVRNHNAWKSHRFVFDNTSLQEIAYLIEENFGVEVKLNSEQLANRTIAGTFSAEKADDLLLILEELLELQSEQIGEHKVLLSENK